MLQALRDYWKTVRSPLYLFPGNTQDVPLSATTIQKMCKQAAREAGITKHVTPNNLRHYATGLMEATLIPKTRVIRRSC
jgi:integrase